MRSSLCGLAAVATAVTVVVGTVMTATAQVSVSISALPQTASGRSAAPVALGTLLDKLWWNPEQQGTLLLVDPGNIRPLSPWERQGSRLHRDEPPPVLPPLDGEGRYRLAALADYFDRRVVPLGSVTTYAPRTMQILNWQHLPPPNPFGSLSSGEKLRLLQSTLTSEQWRRFGSPQGLGAGDLNREQRGLFLSLLPEPFTLLPTQTAAAAEPDSSNSAVTLPASTRENIRLTISRSLGWTFLTEGERGMVGMGNPVSNTPYRLAASAGVPFGTSSSGDEVVEVFGARVRDEIPSRLKPGQLSWEWSALKVPVAVKERETVGELIRRAAEITHAELYCDPRYADLPVYTRGSSAVASDLLRALCWSVSGTFRRVGSAFVFTDDLAGLGTRHAAIVAWAIPGGILAYNAEKASVDRLKANNYADLVGWSADDPLRVSDTLARQIEQQRKAGHGTELTVAVTDLSEPAQSLIQKQVRGYNAAKSPTAPQQAIEPNRVRLTIKLRTDFLVPGVGAIELPVPELGRFGMGLQLEPPESPILDGNYTPDWIKTFTPPPTPKASLDNVAPLRALVLTAASEEDLHHAAAEAKARGFSQVWVRVGRRKSDLPAVEAAIRVGNAVGLPVGIVVDLLRATDQEKDLLRDRSVLAETVREYVARRTNEPTLTTSPPNFTPDYLVQREALAPLRQQPDWLCADDPATVEAILASLTALAKTPGLAAVVLRSTAAPGYSKSQAGLPIVAELGYSEPTRLAFLRQTGMDPVDLSPLPDGALQLPVTAHWITATAFLRLRSFPDAGPYLEVSRPIKRQEIPIATDEGWSRWKAFRRHLADEFAVRTAETLQKSCPGLTVYRQWDEDGVGSWIGRVDAATATAAVLSGRKETSPGDASPVIPVQVARKTSAQVCRLLTFDLTVPGTGYLATIKDPLALFAFTAAYGVSEAKGWDGIVFDLGNVDYKAVLPLLRVLQPAAVAAAAPAEKE